MTTQQITLVQESFTWLKPIAQQAGELFYKNLFDTAPQARAMFKQPIAAQAGKLMYTLGYVVSHLHHPETILQDVAKLGQRHHQYGAQPAHYDIVGAVLLDTLAQGLGKRWNAELKQAWAMAYSMVANAMMEAASQESASAHRQAAVA